jgi:AcrR family transcriptional regulator
MNREARAVPRATPAAGPAGPPDRRVRRTRQALTHALVELVLEKRYRRITVQDLLDRADVGRSTFYAHYRSKDDLLLRSFEAMLELLDGALDRDPPSTRRVAPVAELFHHVGGFEAFHLALARARMLEVLYDAGTTYLRGTIGRRLAGLPADALPPGVPQEVLAQAGAGALFALLRWWLERGRPETPERMDAVFHALVVPRATPPAPPGP